MPTTRNEPAKPIAFLALEEGLSRQILRSFSIETEIQEIIRLVRDNRFAEALAVVDTISAEDAVKKKLKSFETFGMAAQILGAQEAQGSSAKTQLEEAGGFKEQLEQQTLITTESIILLVENQLRTSARNMINQWEAIVNTPSIEVTKVINPRRTRFEVPPPGARAKPLAFGASFAKPFETFMEGERQVVVRMNSSLHTSRMTQWGHLTEAESLGRSFYEVDEVLDVRTCPVCRTMDGKVFPVATARGRLQFMLSNADSGRDFLKGMNPWPRQTASAVGSLEKLATGELIQNGLDTPPYHPFCRGILRKTEKVSDVVLPPSALDLEVGAAVLRPARPRGVPTPSIPTGRARARPSGPSGRPIADPATTPVPDLGDFTAGDEVVDAISGATLASILGITDS